MREYDIVAWSTFDRAIRRMKDIHDLAEWAKDNSKSLKFCTGPLSGLLLDFETENPMTTLQLQIFAFAAEMEAYNAKVRVTGARTYLRAVGRYAGGWTHFGYEPKEREQGKGYELKQDQYGPVARRMVNDIFAGKSLSAIADWLNAEDIPTSKDIVRIRTGKEPKGHGWRYFTVAQILRSRALCGTTELYPDWRKGTKHGEAEIVYGEDGLPLRFTDEPIINDAEWERLQTALDSLSMPTKLPRKDSPWVVGFTSCTVCGKPMYSNRQTMKGKTYEYLRCMGVRDKTCYTRNVKLAELDDDIGQQISETFPKTPYLATRTIEGRNHAAELATVRMAIADYTKKIALAELDDEPAEDDRATLATLRTRYGNLRNMPNEPERIVYVQTGLTIPQHYTNLNGQGKHAMFMSHGAKVRVQQTDDGLVADIDWGTIGAGDLPVISEDEMQALLQRSS
jgi:DNA invertase Pin-like site-specific DNA recombinase